MDQDNVIMTTFQILIMNCGHVREFLRKYTLKYLREMFITFKQTRKMCAYMRENNKGSGYFLNCVKDRL